VDKVQIEVHHLQLIPIKKLFQAPLKKTTSSNSVQDVRQLNW